MYALGARLNKTLSEIGSMPADEFIGWIAFFQSEDDT